MVFGRELPECFLGNAGKAFTKVEIVPSEKACFTVPEAGAEEKLEQEPFSWGRLPEHRLNLFGFINWANGLGVSGPVTPFEQTWAGVPLEKRRDSNQLVADGAGLKPAIEAEVRKLEQVLPRNLVEVGLRAAVKEVFFSATR